MSRNDVHFEQLLPIELKLKVLEAEQDRLLSDAHWIEQRRREVEAEISYYRNLLQQTRRRATLKRVK